MSRLSTVCHTSQQQKRRGNTYPIQQKKQQQQQQMYPVIVVTILLCMTATCHAWVSTSTSSTPRRHQQQQATQRHRLSHFPSGFDSIAHAPSSKSSSCLYSEPTSTSEELASSSSEGNEEDDDDEYEYEYVEYDILTDTDFLGSEWLVGTVMKSNPGKIDETWVRLAVDKDGKNVAIWGDNSQGSWNFDVANQFLSISKANLLGKDIWAGIADDYYYSRGTVRGWNAIAPASVLGQWQARRLGVDSDEAGVAPWFEKESDDEEDDDDDDDDDTPLTTATADDVNDDDDDDDDDKDTAKDTDDDKKDV